MMRVLLIVLFAASAALADRPGVDNPEGVIRMRGVRPEPPPKWARPTLSLALKGGATLPVAGLSPGPHAALELSYAPPVLSRQLYLSLEASWTRPGVDPRPAFRSFAYEVTPDDLAAAALVSFRFLPDGWRVSPYAGAGAAICALRAVTTFDDGALRTEREVRPAIVGLAGVQVWGGSGTFELEVRAQRGASKTRVLEGSSIQPLAFTLGYRLSL